MATERTATLEPIPGSKSLRHRERVPPCEVQPEQPGA